MIVEMREYTLHSGTVPEYLKLYEHEGLAIQREILGHMVGYYRTEVGSAVNEVVHLWAYDSFEDRQQRRARLAADPGWQSYVRKIRPMLVEQRNRIMYPASFFEPELHA
ncbi:MAG: NIPSNAP family protein [Solirubrobacterales bacterium]|nr:NIPSNAP family protein [Solirubrobacterales bacterium]MBV9917108.1 NIPSNAP family protein [Solirubrobacterales bacterium]